MNNDADIDGHQHYNIEGEPISLHRLCHEQPEWARGQILDARAKIRELRQQLNVSQGAYVTATEMCDAARVQRGEVEMELELMKAIRPSQQDIDVMEELNKEAYARFIDYQMDVDSDAPVEHRDFMRKLRAYVYDRGRVK